jgi:hypothetical protein
MEKSNLTTHEISRPTALRTMTELWVIGLVERYKVKDRNQWMKAIRLKHEFDWLTSEEFKSLRQGFEPVDNRAFMKLDKENNTIEEQSYDDFDDDTNKEKSGSIPTINFL